MTDAESSKPGDPPPTFSSAVHAHLPPALDDQITRAVRWAKARANPTASSDSSEISSAAFFELVFGHPPGDDDQARLAVLCPSGVVPDALEAHRFLASFDAQQYPTPFLVRATAGNLRCVELNRFRLWIDDSDPAVSSVIARESDWEAHVAEALAPSFRPGATFVDVGANVGYHTFMAAALVGPAGSVMAFEPNSENCRLLQLSKLENGAENVVILPFALDRTDGIRYLSSHLGTNAGLIPDARDDLLAGRGTPIYATTLDSLAPARIDVLKVDVEGAEFRVLDGARETLRRDKPLLVMEFSCEMVRRVSEVDPAEALQELLDLGYELFILDRDGGGPIAVDSAAKLLADWHDPFRIEDLLLRPR